MIVDYRTVGAAGSVLASGTPITDGSGCGNTGIMMGSGNYVTAPYDTGFTATSQYIQGPHLNLTSWTMSEWVQWNVSLAGGNNSQHDLVSGRMGSTTQGAYDSFYMDSTSSGGEGIHTEVWGVNPSNPADAGWIYADTIAISNSWADSSWHMVTETVTTGQYQVYLDGALLGSSAINSGYTPYFSPDSTACLSVGGNSGYDRMGSLADFRLYSTVLSTNQIQEVYLNQVLNFGNALPTNTPVQLASGATLDLNGVPQTIGSLANSSGSGGTVTSSVSGAVTLTLAPTGSTTFSGRIQDGAGKVALAMNGPGIQVLAGSNTYTGGTTINGGNLVVNGSLSTSGTVNVNATATLSGTGSVGGVTVAAAGTLAPGLGGGTLSAASVNLNAGSDLAYTLGGTNSRLAITGGLTIPVDVISNITPGSSWANGTYVLATYGGTATNNSSSFAGWVVRGTGLGSHIYSFTLGSGSLDMIVAAANAYAGSWTATTGGSWGSSGNWLSGHVPTNLTDTATFGTAIGSGAATITLDANRTLSGLTFSSTGNGNYTITAGTGGILTLDGGGTAVPLSVTSGSDTISAAVDLADNLNFSGAAGTKLTISGSLGESIPGRTLSVGGAGMLVLANSTAYTGATTISGGTLQIGAGGVTGSIDGTAGVTDNATLTFNRSGTYTFGPTISGSGNVTTLGPGVLTLTASNTYSGATTISGGTLQVGNGGTTGSIDSTSGVTDNAALAFNRSDACASAGLSAAAAACSNWAAAR